MRKKYLVIGIIANLISMIVSLGISFVLTPFLIERIGKEAYSFFPISNNFLGYISVITVALNSMAARFITISMVKDGESEARSFFSSVFFANVGLVVLLALPMIMLTFNIEKVLDVPMNLQKEVKILFGLMFLSFAVSLIGSVFGIATFAKERMDLYAYQNFFQSIIKALLYISLFSIFRPSIILMGVVNLFLSIFTVLIQFAISKMLLPDFAIKLYEFEWEKVCVLLKSGIWNSINSLGGSLLLGVSLLLANTMIGAEAAGDLSVIQVLPNFMTTVITSVYSVLLPYITVAYASGDNEKTRNIVIWSQKMLGIVASVPVLVIMVMGRYFYRLWVPNEDAEYLYMLSVIAIIPLLLYSSMWTVYGMNVANNTIRQPAIVYLLTGGCRIVISIVLIQLFHMGTIGIVLGETITGIVYYFIYLIGYAATQMKMSRWTFYPHVIKTYLLCAIELVVFSPIISQFTFDNWISFFVACAFVEMVGIVIYYRVMFNRFDREQVKELLSQKFLFVSR